MVVLWAAWMAAESAGPKARRLAALSVAPTAVMTAASRVVHLVVNLADYWAACLAAYLAGLKADLMAASKVASWAEHLVESSADLKALLKAERWVG